MGFMDDNDISGEATIDKYLKFPELHDKGETFEVKIRILDEKAPGVFRHWIGADGRARPYNCPGQKQGCPACRERNAQKDAGNEDWRQLHKMDRRYFVNVLVDGQNKVLAFPTKLGEKLMFLQERYGVVEDKKTGVKEQKYDLRDFDISIIKRKSGDMKFNVEYDAIFEGVRPLNEDEKALTDGRFDLDEEIKPSTNELVAAALRGEEPVREEPQRMQEPVGLKLATQAQIEKINKLREGKYTWSQLLDGSPDPAGLTDELAREIITSLQ